MIIPEQGEMSIRIVGFDPGTAHLGCAVLDWVWGEEMPRIIYATTIHAADDTVDSSMAEVLGKRDARMRAIRKELRELLELARPTFAITETPFMQRGKLSAYESGVEIQLMLRECMWDYSPRIHVNGINPKTLKNHVGVEHKGTSKDDVANAIKKMYKGHSDIELKDLDEHSFDAIGAANYFWRAELQHLSSLIQPKPKNKKPKTKKRRRPRRRKGK